LHVIQPRVGNMSHVGRSQSTTMVRYYLCQGKVKTDLYSAQSSNL